MAIEMRRNNVIAVALHPGTTATDLSKPFQRNVKPEKLFSPEYTAGMLLDVLEGLTGLDGKPKVDSGASGFASRRLFGGASSGIKAPSALTRPCGESSQNQK